MTINFELTGKERKTLVEAISRELNITAKYLGMPSAAFQIGDCSVSKNGVLTGADNRGLIAALSGVHGFNTVTEEYDCETQTAPEDANAGDTAPEAIIVLNAEAETTTTSNAETETTAVSDAASEALPGDCENISSYDPDGYDGEAAPGWAAATTVIFAKDGGFETVNIEYPLAGFTPDKLENLSKMITAKAPLIKAALGTDALPVQQTDNALVFSWLKGDVDGEQLNACTTLINLLCKTALTKKRVTAKERVIEGSPKYAFRVFLLSLGFIGREFRDSRRVLLSRLEGSSAWRDDKKADAPEPDNRNENTTANNLTETLTEEEPALTDDTSKL